MGIKNAIAFIIIFLCLVFPTAAQMLDNTKGDVFSDRPFFNKDFIKEKHIKSLSGKVINYKLEDKLRNTEYFKQYNFNNKGELIEEYESQVEMNQDTLIRFYAYDDRGNLIQVKQRDKYGYYLYSYKYNEDNLLTHYEFRRKYDPVRRPPNAIELGDADMISSESYSYKRYDNQLKQTVFNDLNAPFKEVIFYYDSEGVLQSELERIIRTSKTTHKVYHYNDTGYIDSVTYQSKIGKGSTYKYVFAYDEKGNLTKKEAHRDHEYITQYQVVYKDGTGLVNDVLVQDVRTNYIKVIALRDYTFYED